MKRFLGFLFIVSLVAFAAGSVLALENQPVSVSGKVVLVKPASSQLLVAYRKEGALVESISTFNVDEKTQLKNLANIAELKINDSITISYVESGPGSLIAQSIEKQQAVLPAPSAAPVQALQQ